MDSREVDKIDVYVSSRFICALTSGFIPNAKYIEIKTENNCRVVIE